MKTIRTESAPAPLGHYEQAIVSRGMLYLSTQLPIVPGETPHKLANASVGEQAAQLFKNLQALLQAASCTPKDIVRLTLYVTSMQNWEPLNEAATRFLGNHKPARGVICVPSLHMGYSVSADLVAEAPTDGAA